MRRLLLASAVVLAALGGLAASGRPAEPAIAPAGPEAAVLDADVAFFRRRIEADPYGAQDRLQLGVLHLRRARATGNAADLDAAVALARSSLALRGNRNTAALQLLAAALLALHQYPEAMEAAATLTAADPESRSFLALRAELEMETGRYSAAESSFARLRPWAADLAVAPRYARWLELHGRLDEAHALLVRAREAADGAPLLSGEQRAWFAWRVGDLAMRYGRLGEARAAFEDALASHPGDHRALAALARWHALRGDWPRAARYAEDALAGAPDPALLGLLGDTWSARGDSIQAGDYYAAVDAAVGAQDGAWHREWSLFLLDHGWRTGEVLAQAEADTVARTDVHGFDLLAWALYRQGRLEDAAVAAARALRLGTRDPLIRFHAGMIALALGQCAEAADHLDTALKTNPRFHHTWATVARETLRNLRTSSCRP